MDEEHTFETTIIFIFNLFNYLHFLNFVNSYFFETGKYTFFVT